MTKEEIIKILEKNETQVYENEWDDIDFICRGSYEKVADEIMDGIEEYCIKMIQKIGDICGSEKSIRIENIRMYKLLEDINCIFFEELMIKDKITDVEKIRIELGEILESWASL